MKKRRLISVLLCLLMTSAAALPISAAGTGTTAAVPVKAPENRIAQAKEAFRSLLDKCASNYDTSTWRFDFAFIDSDDVPELLVSLTEENIETEVQVYRYDAASGLALFTDTFGTYGSMAYLPYQNKIWDYDVTGDARIGNPAYKDYGMVSGLYQMDGTPYLQGGTNLENITSSFIYNEAEGGYRSVLYEEWEPTLNYINNIRDYAYVVFDAKTPNRCYVYSHENFDLAFEKAYEKISKVKNYCDVYAYFLYEMEKLYPDRNFYFTTVRIEDDVVPELILTESLYEYGDMLVQGTIILCTVQNNEPVVLFAVSEYLPEMQYLWEKNSIYISYANSVGTVVNDWTEHYASIGDGELLINKSFVQKLEMENDPLSATQYFVDEQEVTEETYTAEREKVQFEGAVSVNFLNFGLNNDNIKELFDYYR